MARIKDVAREANVSIATVSRVINNVPLVNEDTRQKVLEAIKKTGYKPNAVARSLKLQKSNTIGVIINDITRPVMTNALMGIQEHLSQNGYSTIISYTKGIKNAEVEALDMFFLRQCDGVILIGTNLDENTVATIKAANLPAISCLVVPNDGKLAGVGIDEYEASKIVTEYLIKKGHIRIGSFMGNDLFDIIPPRISGFIDAMKKNDLLLNADWILRGPMTFKGGYDCAKQIISLPKDKLPTAIFCFNDDMAIGAIKAFVKNGIKIPDDISIISLNGSVFADWNTISVTSLRPDSYKCGEKGAEILCSMIHSGEIHSDITYIPMSIVEGDSVRDLTK